MAKNTGRGSRAAAEGSRFPADHPEDTAEEVAWWVRSGRPRPAEQDSRSATRSTTTRTLRGQGSGPTLAELDTFLDQVGHADTSKVTVSIDVDKGSRFEPRSWSISVTA